MSEARELLEKVSTLLNVAGHAPPISNWTAAAAEIQAALTAAEDKGRLEDRGGRWISVEERLPDPGVRVFAHSAQERGATSGLLVIAEYSDGRSLLVNDDYADLDNWARWDEDAGEYFCPADTWFESNRESETNFQITAPTHWQPLPHDPLTAGEGE